MNVYEVITNNIISKLENGVVPWRQPWKGIGSQNLVTGHSYSGINLFMTFGYERPYFATFKQINELGLKLKKGSKALPIVFWMKYEKRNDQGELESSYMTPRFYQVFNVASIEASDKLNEILAKKDIKKDIKPIESAQAIADKYLKRSNSPALVFGESKAYYSPSRDIVNMPPIDSFKDAESYHSVLFHELAHSTGHMSRLKREGVIEAQAFGNECYSKEELIAELSAAYLCADSGINNSTLDMSAAYLGSWIKVLKGDSKMIFQASSAATKAANYIKGDV